MPRTPNTNVLREATSRDFSGGLNVADSELNLSSKYARELNNMVLGIDGAPEVRQGTLLFADILALSDYPISNHQYFGTNLIVVNTRGEIFAVNGRGEVSRIWDSAIARAKRAGLTIWSGAEFVVFLEFNGNLLVSNGKDKPLSITVALNVDYLADLGTGSNINVPIGSVMAAFSNHVFIASGYLLNVSERNAAGTWLGDPGTQFVNQFDMRSYVTTGDTTIIGLWKFKQFLIVAFREVLVPIQITEVTTPANSLALNVSEDSVINNYGALSPRVGQDIGEMNLIADIVGVASQALTTFTKILAPDRPSRFVDPILQPAINQLSVASLYNDTFSVFDRRLGCYMLFIPNNELQYQKNVICFNYRVIDKLNIKSWSLYKGWNWHAASRSSEGNIFYSRANDTTIFLQGDSKTNPLNRDFIGEQETFSDGTTFTDQTGLSPVANVRDSGVPIKFSWELPWSDFKHRALSKTLKYVILDTEGNQQFNTQVYVDDFYETENEGEFFSDGTLFTDFTGFDPWAERPRTPALETALIAKDAGGYGFQHYGTSPYGSGNNTRLRTLTYQPTKFNTMKLRFEGETVGPLKFVAITALYQLGSIRRNL